MGPPPTLARVLVTGGQGFIGAYILRDLVRRGSLVAALDLKDDTHILEQVLSAEELAKVHRVAADITDSAAITDFVVAFQPTAVVHLAGMQIPLVREKPALGAAVNVVGTVNVFEAVKALANSAGEPRRPVPVVYASSAAVLGPSSDYAGRAQLPAEQDYHKPRTLYGVLKLCNEGTARIYWQEYGIPSVGLRPLTVFGVGREVGLTSASTKAVKAAVLGRRFECQVTGLTGFQYVVDIARFFVEAAVAADVNHRGAHVCGIRGHLLSHEAFLREAARAVPAVAEYASVAASATEVPIHGDVDEAPLQSLLGSGLASHTPLGVAVAEMAADFNALKHRGLLRDADLGPPPAKL